MFCEKCGSKLPDVCIFCTNCGARVEAAPVEIAPVEAAPVEAAPVEAAPVEAAPVEAAPVEAALVEAAPVEAALVEAVPVEAVNNKYMQVPAKEKKPFPVWINVILFIFTFLSIVALITTFVLGKMATKDSKDDKDVIATSAKAVNANEKKSQTEILEFELGGTVYEIDIPETEASIVGTEFVNGYIFENSDSEYLDYDYLIENYTVEIIGYAYYEIYARYGVIFEDTDITAYFNSKTWYEPIMTEEEFIEDDSIVLNDYEVANISTIEEAFDYLY